MMPVGLKAMRWNQTRMLKKADRLDHSREPIWSFNAVKCEQQASNACFIVIGNTASTPASPDLNPSDRSTKPEIYV